MGLRLGYRLGEVHLITARPVSPDEKATLQVQMLPLLQGGTSQAHKENQNQYVERLFVILIVVMAYSTFCLGVEEDAVGQSVNMECSSSWVPCIAKPLEAVPETQAVTSGVMCGTGNMLVSLDSSRGNTVAHCDLISHGPA